MLDKVRRLITAEKARNQHLETQVKKWLADQLLAPAPGRPRTLVLGKGLTQRTCHINPRAVTVRGTEYVDLEVRAAEGSELIMRIRTRAATGQYIETLW